MQLQELYHFGKQTLRDHSIDTPGLEAYMLLWGSELVDDLSEVYSHPERKISPDGINRFKILLERRIGREPAAYIMGEKEFYSRSFKVNPSVLIPRAETELLVDETLETINMISSARVLEVGTGSGCVAITLASMCNDISLVATDISNDALLVAKVNSIDHMQCDRISFLRTDMLSCISSGTFDIVVSNPPYIKAAEFPNLEPEVREFEPTGALLAGTDGLDYIREIISESTRVLNDNGFCLLEVGQGQADKVTSIFKDFGYVDITHAVDINGIKRVVRAKWKR